MLVKLECDNCDGEAGWSELENCECCSWWRPCEDCDGEGFVMATDLELQGPSEWVCNLDYN